MTACSRLDAIVSRDTVRWILALSLLLGASTLPLAAQLPGDLGLELVTSGLDQPIAVRHAGDGSGRLFIVEQPGRILIYDTATETLLPTPFLNISGRVDDDANEQGLLGLDFHPDFATNGEFFVSYTRDPGPGLDQSVVSRFTVSAGDPDIADDTSEVAILVLDQDFDNHNGGDIHFGPDGYLYVALGDGGSGNDPNNRAQTLTTLLGKMLRIDVDGTPPPAPNDLCGLVTSYGIPGDNPFAGGSGDCDEIWSLGWRNPWRFSFDRANGDLFVGDVGQDAMEEVDHEPAATGGRNYGWRCMEGTLTNITDPPCNGTLTPPLFTYLQSDGGCSVVGGYRYRGSVIGGAAGAYFFADYCFPGPIWTARQTTGGSWTQPELWQEVSVFISSFGEDEAGELYVIDIFGGRLYRIVSPSSIFTDGFESGDIAVWTAVP